MDLQQRIERLERQWGRIKAGVLLALGVVCAASFIDTSSNARPHPLSPAAAMPQPATAPALPRPPAAAPAEPDAAEPSANLHASSEFEVADEGGTIQGIFIVFGSGNVFNLGGPNGHNVAQIGGNATAPVEAASTGGRKRRSAARARWLASLRLPAAATMVTGLLGSPAGLAPLLVVSQFFIPTTTPLR